METNNLLKILKSLGVKVDRYWTNEKGVCYILSFSKYPYLTKEQYEYISGLLENK